MSSTSTTRKVSVSRTKKAPIIPAVAAAPLGPASPAGPAPTSPTIAGPPPAAVIPAVPAGFVPPTGVKYVGVTPRKAELAVLPSALSELQQWTTYTQTLGTMAPPYGEVVQLLAVAGAWSQMRAQTDGWDKYSKVQEGVTWAALRAVLAVLSPLLETALAANPSLATQLPSVAALLGVRKASAKKAASARLANTKATGAGLPATHGAVGKARLKSAEKAAYAAAAAKGSTTPAAPATGAVVPAPAPTIAAPSPAPAVLHA